MSNDRELLANIPAEDGGDLAVKIVNDSQIKTLGINWNPIKDTFSFSINLPEVNAHTKRSVLSNISKIYDPFGWISPVSISSKIFLQKLWLHKLDWDDKLPPDLCAQWLSLKADLVEINSIEIHRWIGCTDSHIGLELHGFCDASMGAYAAVVYIRIMYDLDNIHTSLLASKTRVSPLNTVSVPRLELCGAALLTELVSSIQQILQLHHVPVYLWTDSTIVLAWLSEHPSTWTVFVANRVSLIHQKQPNAKWHHVKSKENPADAASRGITSSELKSHEIWWTGPNWLRQNSTYWPIEQQLISEDLSSLERRTSCMLLQPGKEPELPLIYRYSKLNTLLRVTAYCLRWRFKGAKDRSLSLEELNYALMSLVRIVQKSHFPNEIKSLLKNEPINTSSKLAYLNPTLDDSLILRVDGRLKNALLAYDEKQPIILPKASHFTTLVIRHSHHVTLHGGVQATLQHLRSKYWIVGGRSTVRKITRQCVTCCRYRSKAKAQLMADLPKDRVQPAKPFLHSGVDYAGPFSIKSTRARERKILKSWVAIFVCFVTRAVHLELVTDLTSEAFLAAFRRFVSRRGRCAKLYSDNAGNFVATDKELRKYVAILQEQSQDGKLVLDNATEWHFIPAASPHFGGLWEAAVKAFKYHFRRIVGPKILTIEEMNTLLAQIEACLNSRPISALSDDPNDISALTPGHFLAGESIITPPEASTLNLPENRLNRWQLVQNLLEHTWRRWYHEYLSKLLLRKKWTKEETPVKVNDLVLVIDEAMPPSRWLLGRITACYPGADKRTRVVSIKTKSGTLKRAITKLIKLPLREECRHFLFYNVHNYFARPC